MKKKGYFTKLRKVVAACNIIVEVVDARFPESKSIVIEKLVKQAGRRHLVVLNKTDLMNKKKLNTVITSMSVPCIVVSAKQRRGKAKILRVLHTMAHGRDVRVGVVGFPNVGKSSVINYLSGRHATGVSPRAGYTKGIQWIRLSEKVLLMDSPGVIPTPEGKGSLALRAAVSPEEMGDPIPTACQILRKIMSKNKSKLLRYYNIGEKAGDEEDILEKIALRRGKLLKGGLPNIDDAAKLVVRDWQKGNIRI